MNSQLRLSLVCAVLFATVFAVQSSHVPHIRLSFKVSARGLAENDIHGKVSPYIKLYSTDRDDDNEIKFGESETLTHTFDPDWSDIFTFDYNPLKSQKWHIVVKDDNLYKIHGSDGEAWVSVNDYVDRDEYLQVNLSNKGYLIIKKA